MTRHWRMAFMLVARNGDIGTLAQTLRAARGALQAALPEGSTLRLGIRPGADAGDGAGRAFPITDAAIEATIAEAKVGELPHIAGDWLKPVAAAIDPLQCCAMAGSCNEIIAPQPGKVFYSLTFRRDPRITVEEFRDWWAERHGPLASKLLRNDLLGYDQVHVDFELSRQINGVVGFDWPGYDAYDNLTWASLDTYLKMTEKTEAMQAMYEDELGFADHSTYKGALLAEI